MNRLLLCLTAWLLALAAAAGPDRDADDFVSVVGTRFYRDGKPYYYVGANMWYAPVLASEGRGGDRRRLCAELDSLHATGTDLLRFHLTLWRESGDSLSATLPPLWLESGAPNDTLLDGLDFLMKELEARGMRAVACLTATAHWSSGPGFYDKEEAVSQHLERIRFLVGRTNRYTQRPYKEDPVLMAWEIGDRPRAVTEAEHPEAFGKFVIRVAGTIKKADGNHLVAVESCGLRGYGLDERTYEQIQGHPLVDYATLQFWPWEWDWMDRSRVAEDLPHAFLQAGSYLEKHVRMAHELDKPLVLDAFSYPRDRFFFSHEQTTFCRNEFYTFVLSQIVRSKERQDALAGGFFWNWAGAGRSETMAWEPGCYVGDTPDRPQGLFAVFDCDSTTMQLLRQTTEQLRRTD